MTSQQKPPVGQWNMPHRAVVFIHGVGEQERGDTLMDFLTSIVMWMERRLSPKFETKFGTNTPHLDSHPYLGGERAYVRITLGDHRFELTESLWAKSFKPLPNDLLIRWAARFLVFMWWQNWFNFVVNILFHPAKRKIGWWHPPYEVLHSIFLILVFLLGLPLGLLLIALLWLTDAVPLPDILPNTVASALKGIMNFLAKGFGDAGAYMEDPARRDAIRQVTEDILEQYQANPACEQVIVFAHSQGSVVAYDVLSHNPQFTKCKTFITIGSILSPIQRMYQYPHSLVFEKHLQKPLRWIFLYARYDPGPGGGLSDWFHPKFQSQDVKAEEILVDNRDTITEDHSTYSLNRDQVVSLILDEMFGPTAHHNPYYRDQTQRDKDFQERRHRVAGLAFWRTLTYCMLIGVFAFFVVASNISATPATSILNGLINLNLVKQTFGQSVKLVYRVPSAEDGSITFVPDKRTLLENNILVTKPDRSSFVVNVKDRNDQPKIVPRALDRTPDNKSTNGEWIYSTDESNLRTGLGNLVFWGPWFRHLVLPALFASLVGAGLLILFRFYRDIPWKHFYEEWQKDRHKEYKEWRDQQP